MKTLIDNIEMAMLEDDEDRYKQSDYLQEAYESADEQGQKSINDCFIALCGYSIPTLLNGYGK